MEKSIMVPSSFINKIKNNSKKRRKTMKKFVIDIIKRNAEGAQK